MKNRICKPRQVYVFKSARSISAMALAFGFSFSMPAATAAQTVSHSGEMNVPYGHSYRDENTPYNPSTRDANGNRLIVNGRFVNGDGSTLVGGIGGDFFGGQAGTGAAGAIGNQLNVLTVGNWNTVIIDSTQINNGNQTVNLNDATNYSNPPAAPDVSQTGELNGEINLDD